MDVRTGLTTGDVLTAAVSLVGVLAAAAAVLLLVLALAVRRVPGGRTGLRDALRLLPACLTLVRRLLADPGLPRAARWWLRGLLAYLLSPIDLVPDVVPILGWADDVLVAVLVLRHVLRLAGEERVTAAWPGSAEGLAALLRLVR